MGRAPCCDKANVKRGPWSPQEDDKLKSYIEKHGTGGNWIALPQKIGLKRCGKSCRLRWLNYLRPNIKHGGFTEDEDNLICSLYITIGSRWSIIAAQLPGRTDNDIKNYWNTRLKKKLFSRQRSDQRATNKINYTINSSSNITNLHPHQPPLVASIGEAPPSNDPSADISFMIPSSNHSNAYCDQYQQVSGISTVDQQMGGESDFYGLPPVTHVDRSYGDGIMDDIMVHRMPQEMDGQDCLWMMDSWGSDIDCLVYPFC